MQAIWCLKFFKRDKICEHFALASLDHSKFRGTGLHVPRDLRSGLGLGLGLGFRCSTQLLYGKGAFNKSSSIPTHLQSSFIDRLSSEFVL